MMGWDAMAARAAEAGLEFTTYPSVPPWPADLRHEDGWERIELALFGAATEQDILAEAEDLRRGLVVIDCMLTAGYAAAQRLRRPGRLTGPPALRAVRAPVGQRGPGDGRR